MLRDFAPFLWLLKLGALVNLYFLARSFAPPLDAVDARLLVPARILFAVSAFRCLFPNQYKGNVVFHDTPLSSIFLTRGLATFAEIGFLFQISEVLRLLNVDRIAWIDAVSWGIVVQVVLSQICVWGAILGGRQALYFWEELGWAIGIAANAIASAALWPDRAALGDAGVFLWVNLLFGVVYSIWQVPNLRLQIADARRAGESLRPWAPIGAAQIREGLRRSLCERQPTTDAARWGGLVVLLWMAGYFATLLPVWSYAIVAVFAK